MKKAFEEHPIDEYIQKTFPEKAEGIERVTEPWLKGELPDWLKTCIVMYMVVMSSRNRKFPKHRLN